MEVTTGGQLFVFGGSIVCGAALGLVFDLFRIHRKFFKIKAWFLSAVDILFWIVSALIFAQFILVANSGMIRVFELAGVFIGGLIYFKFVSKAATNFCVYILKTLNKIAAFIIKITLLPCVLIYKILRKPCMLVASKCSDQRKKIIRFAKRI